MAVQHLHSTEELRQVVESSGNAGVVLVDFYAQWCGPCRVIAPKLDDLAKNYAAEGVRIYKVDIEEVTSVTRDHGVQMMPTFIFFQSGKEVDRVIGADLNKLRRTLLNLLTIS